jgi:hypothetical protein
MADNYYTINVMLEKKLLEEVSRFKEINTYTQKLIGEQAPPPPEEEDPFADLPPEGEPFPGAEGGDLPPAEGGGGGLPPPEGGDLPPPEGGDLSPPEGGDLPPAEDETEEIDITDLVNMTKSIKKGLEDKQQDNSGVIEKMDSVFARIDDLEQKLSQMDAVIDKIDQLGSKMDTMKVPTPQEKLELRSLDSYPFNQNPTEFFNEKQGEMRRSGKNEYVLTKQDIEDYGKETIRTSFNPEMDDDEEDEYTFKL